jgi:hypothetical protein
VHPVNATGNQIIEINRQFERDIVDHQLFLTAREALKQQILLAVAFRYLQVLKDADMGFADVSLAAILNHLKSTYGTITPEGIEDNRSLLGSDWNPEDPIEDLWLRIKECQRFATAATEPIPNAAAICLILAALEKSGVFSSAVEKWRDKEPATQTLANFQSLSDFENKERLRKLTAKSAGYHGSHNADIIVPPSPGTAAAATPALAPPSVDVGNGLKMYYCWSHGLGKNEKHTSATCEHPKDGHKTNATADKMQRGNNTISSGWRMSSSRRAPAPS